jgi:brefeldin A-inhibited guanine nucleotide-exchange protein
MYVVCHTEQILDCKAVILKSLEQRTWSLSKTPMFPRPDPPQDKGQKNVHHASPASVSAAAPDSASPDFPSLEREPPTTEFNATAFNIKPVSTVMKALAAGLFPRGAPDVVQLLLQTPLDRAAVGDLLGDGTPFCNELRQQYVSCFSFSSIDMLDALRKFMSAFKLPGEAQKIDRIVEAFAREFHKANPTVFSHQDTVHKLAFSVLMLNTDKHNKGIRKKDKMSCEGFIRNNRGLDEGKDLPRPYLASIYHRIEVVPLMETHGLSEAALAGSKISSLSSVITDPVKIRNLEKTLVAFSNPKSQSWLMKKGSRMLGWQRRWGLVNNKCMYLFLSPPSWGIEVSLKAVIPLDSVRSPTRYITTL